jgi:hypothetical protein
MALPLSPLASSALNLRSPPTAQRGSVWQASTEQDVISYKYTGGGIGDQTLNDDDLNDPPSSPFVPEPRKSRSPTKQQSPTKSSAKKKPQSTAICGEEMLRQQNEDFAGNESSVIHYGVDDDSVSAGTLGQSGYTGMDDTAFSTFSAVPNTDMTLFARLGEHSDDTGGSPAKQLRAECVARYHDHVSDRLGGSYPALGGDWSDSDIAFQHT